jgi:hypothetical protein
VPEIARVSASAIDPRRHAGGDSAPVAVRSGSAPPAPESTKSWFAECAAQPQAGGVTPGSHTSALAAHEAAVCHAPQTASVPVHSSIRSTPPAPPQRIAPGEHRSEHAAAAALHFRSFPHAWPDGHPVVVPGAVHGTWTHPAALALVSQTSPCAAHSVLTQVPQTGSAPVHSMNVAVPPSPVHSFVLGVHRVSGAVHAAARSLHLPSLPHACPDGQSTAVPGAPHGAPSTFTLHAASPSAARRASARCIRTSSPRRTR